MEVSVERLHDFETGSRREGRQENEYSPENEGQMMGREEKEATRDYDVVCITQRLVGCWVRQVVAYADRGHPQTTSFTLWLRRYVGQQTQEVEGSHLLS
jgi:hypothetical protein